MRRVLMVAFHFPPFAGSSGVQRTLRFVQHLPAFGWEPLVLTAHPRAYEKTSDDLAASIPVGTVVERAFALDTAQHLSIMGRFPAFLARPDRWQSWRYDATSRGLNLIRAFRPDVLWSTYPIATAHAIGIQLKRRSGLPWIADFRDPMVQDGYPADDLTRQSFARIEERALDLASFSVFTTPGAARTYRARYPAAAERIAVVENGFDEETFAGLIERSPAIPLEPGAVCILHSGVIYPSERDPSSLFEAMEMLVSRGDVRPDNFKLRLRATGHDALMASMVRARGLEGIVSILPSIPYREALEEMLRADGLLVLQASNCNEQIPAKLYEYLRARRPIVGLTDPAGDTAQTLRDAGSHAIARLDSAQEIVTVLGRFIEQVRAGTAALPDQRVVTAASRRARTEALATLMERSIRSQEQCVDAASRVS